MHLGAHCGARCTLTLGRAFALRCTGKYAYMNIEIVAVKLQGIYPCGTPGKPSDAVLRSGWADQPCDCDNALEFSNCGRALLRSGTHNGTITARPWRRRGAPSSVPTDCTSSAPVDPSWFRNCTSDGGCVRVKIASSVPSLVLTNSSFSGNVTAGYDWCIDGENYVAYAKITGVPRESVAFFEAFDDKTGHFCRFLTHHWTDGDLVRVYNQVRVLSRAHAACLLPRASCLGFADSCPVCRSRDVCPHRARACATRPASRAPSTGYSSLAPTASRKPPSTCSISRRRPHKVRARPVECRSVCLCQPGWLIARRRATP